uniref:Protein vav n=1 Tax=Syphacia muris TaxID=451379 RepID=A0A0N5AHT5_9BILA
MITGVEPWRECVKWMMDCGVLDATHRVGDPNTSISEFAMLLRDGVLLCVLCNQLSPNCINPNDWQQRPQMAQFLCCKNICEFLKACENTFKLDKDDLFDPWDLYRLNDFAKVLKTLSKLSQSEKAKLTGHKGFTLHLEPSTSSEYGNEEAVYRSLKDDVEDNEVVVENAYDLGSKEDEKTSGRIYDTIVCQRSSEKRERIKDSDKWSTWKPVTHREHCIKELYDTETNYVENALDMLINKFYIPLEGILSRDDHEIIFMNILKLACIHRSFLGHLRQAVLIAVNLERSPTKDENITIGDVFKTWKEKFTAYGFYCSHLPESRSKIATLLKADQTFEEKLKECAVAANCDGFMLGELLGVPVQRILKYHLLLSDMIKSTSIESNDLSALKDAKEAMIDINTYINEVSRDYEMQQYVSDIEKSIPDLEMSEGMHLISYGKHVADGEIKISDSTKEGSKMKNRYVFIFDRVMIICKSLRGNQYSYRDAYFLRDFRIDVDTDNSNKFGTLTRKLTANGSYYFSLVQETNEGSNVLNMCCKTITQRDKWVQYFRSAQDNEHPKDAEETGHELRYQTYDKPSVCSHCQKLFCGLFFQGYHCNYIPPQHNEIVRATQSFRSSDPRFLSFDKNDFIEILQQCGNGTIKGRVVTNREKIGFVALERVSRCRSSASSLQSFHSPDSIFDMDSSSNSALSPIDRASNVSSPQLPRQGLLNHRSSTDSMISLRTQTGPDYINEDVIGQEWYQGSLERAEAEMRLRGTPDGTYLVRFSNTQQKYVISISFNGEVKHTKIEQNYDNLYYLDELTMFPGIVELINYYREHNLRESFESLDTPLKEHYYPPNQPYKAIYDYHSEEPGHLELKVGQIVYVVDRKGEERGWWKGKSGNRTGYFPLTYVKPFGQSS